jgi:NADPH-ferrihemoprotein reductase
VLEDRRNIIAVLEDLQSFKPPLDHLLELLPRLQARYYSISSSAKMHPTSVHITAVLVEYTTRTNRTNRGVATSWLKRKQQKMQAGGAGVFAPIYIRHSSLRLPYHSSKPVIMVGPGTGLAPFRGFIQDRATVKQAGKELGQTVLFFGCRHKSEDFIYEEELEGYRDDRVLSQLNVAFSRDQPEKVYVQHLLREKGAEVWSLLEKQGYFYVCGDARHMARDVQTALLQVIQEEGGLDSHTASEYVKKLQKRNRYLQDVWS